MLVWRSEPPGNVVCEWMGANATPHIETYPLTAHEIWVDFMGLRTIRPNDGVMKKLGSSPPQLQLI